MTLVQSAGSDTSVLTDILSKTSDAGSVSRTLEGVDNTGGSEQLVLEHYRIAVYELTRQNLLLKRQLAAVEERLANEDAYSEARYS